MKFRSSLRNRLNLCLDLESLSRFKWCIQVKDSNREAHQVIPVIALCQCWDRERRKDSVEWWFPVKCEMPYLYVWSLCSFRSRGSWKTARWRKTAQLVMHVGQHDNRDLVTAVDLTSMWMTYWCDVCKERRGTKRQLGLCSVHGECQKLSENCTVVRKGT